MLWDSDNPHGETAVVQSITSSGATPYLETTTALTGNYTTAKTAKVKLLSCFTSIFTTNATGTITTVSIPSSEEVMTIINTAEQEIETQTRTAFREKTVTEESHHWPLFQYRPQDWLDGLAVPFNYRNVRGTACADGCYTLDHAAGDKAEVYSGGSWTDYLTTYTGGANGAHYIDKMRGCLFLRQFYKLRIRYKVRLTYRYGLTTVPADIRRATALLVAAQLLEMESAVVKIPGGGDLDIVSVQERARIYREEARRIIKRYSAAPFIFL